MAVMESIALSFAGISAAKDGIDLWERSRSRSRVATALNEGVGDHLIEAREAAENLKSVREFYDNDELTDIFTARSNRCYNKLKEVLNGNLPDEIVDTAIANYKLCVCKEMNRLRGFGPLPSSWELKWDDFFCSSRNLPSF